MPTGLRPLRDVWLKARHLWRWMPVYTIKFSDRGRGIGIERAGVRRCGVGGVCFEGGGVRCAGARRRGAGGVCFESVLPRLPAPTMGVGGWLFGLVF